MERIQEIIKSNNLHTTEMNKLFYGIYPFRISVDLTKFMPTNESLKRIMDKIIHGRTRNSIYEVMIYSAIQPLATMQGKWKTVRNGHMHQIFFFEEENDTVDFINKSLIGVCDVTLPCDQKTLDLIKTEHQTIIRPTLFWNKYRWRITFKSEWGKVLKWKTIYDSIREYFSEEKMHDAYINWGSYHKYLYVDSEHDVLIIKLMHGEHVNKIERVTLKEEIQ